MKTAAGHRLAAMIASQQTTKANNNAKCSKFTAR
jgi:hypothetical protein